MVVKGDASMRQPSADCVYEKRDLCEQSSRIAKGWSCEYEYVDGEVRYTYMGFWRGG